MNLRYITRFTYTFTNFQGWRVAIRRQGHTLTRYFSDRQYENPDTALQQAINFRDRVLQELEQHPEQAIEILTKNRPQPLKLYPAGLKPGVNTPTHEDALQEESKAGACSVRSNKVMQPILKSICKRLHLDMASVIKLSLYLFSLQYGYAAETDKSIHSPSAPRIHPFAENGDQDQLAQENLIQLINELEQLGKNAGLPSFEEFSTGKISTQHTTSAGVTA